MRAIGEDDGFARIQVRLAIRVAPKYVETSGCVQAGKAGRCPVPADLLREPGEDRLEHDCFDYCEESLSWNLFPVRIFYASEAGESAQSRADACDYKVRARNAHIPQCFHTLTYDLLQLRPHLILVIPDFCLLALTSN